MDWLSQLPDFILHHILSFCNPIQLVRMSVLSKNWFDLTASFPILNFSTDNFESRQCFFRYVDYTTSSFCHQDLTADTFNLVTTIKDPAELDTVNKCLELILKKGVNVLKIDITSASGSARYCLPNTLLSVSVLKSLTISDCELPSSFMVDAVKFKSLIRLTLVNVPIDDEVIKYLITSCPLLRVFRIKFCNGFKRFCVYGHQNLKRVSIYYKTRVEMIHIEAPDLSSLVVTDWDETGAPQMNLTSCKKLKKVAYFGYPLPNSNGFNGFLSNFPFIENLFLGTNYICKNLKLSSPSLMTLLLHSNCDLENIELDTPELDLFSYLCNVRILEPRQRVSTDLKASVHCYPGGCIDALWFQNLWRFLHKKIEFEVFNLYIHAAYSEKFKELEKLKAIKLPPYELDHVELQLEGDADSLAHIAFVEAVLWCCRPESLTLRSSFSFEEESDVVKFTYKKLVDQGNTDIQIVSPTAFLLALPREEKAISFMKEEVVQQEADNAGMENFDALDLGS